jgi:hypothetical protein
LSKREFVEKIEELKEENKISDFLYKHIFSKIHNISDEDMLSEILADVIAMGNYVNSQEDLERYVGAQNFVPAFIDKLEADASDDDIVNMCVDTVRSKADKLDDVGKIVFDYFNKRKLAYPSNSIWVIPEPRPRDINDWIGRMDAIRKEVAAGVKENDAFSKYTQDMTSHDRAMFDSWKRYYENGDHMRYKKADLDDGHYINLLNEVLSSSESQKADDTKQKKERAEARAKRRELKKKMLSRLRALDRLIDSYALDYSFSQDADDISSIVKDPSKTEQTLSNVKKLQDAFSQLKSTINETIASASVDKMYKIAGLAEEAGFNKFSKKLQKVAQEFETPAQQVDREAATPSKNLAGMQRAFNRHDSVEEIKSKASPKEILRKLETLDKFLRDKSLIRELSEIDVMLGELGMAQYFEEVYLCQQRLLDAMSYSTAKLDSAISKLRSGIVEQEHRMMPVKEEVPQESPTAEKVEVVEGEPEV